MESIRKRRAILTIFSFVIFIALGIVFESLSPFVFLVILAIAIGWLISLPLWLILRFTPSLRTAAHASRRIRWTMIGIVALFVLPTLFVLYGYLKSYVTVVFYPVMAPLHPDLSTWRDAQEFREFQRSDIDGAVEMYGDLMVKELWLRQVAFPPLRKSCYSSDHVCGLAD